MGEDDTHRPRRPDQMIERAATEVSGEIAAVEEATDDIANAAGTTRWRIIIRVVFLLIAAVALYGLAPQLIDVWAELPNLREVTWWWFPLMLAFEAASMAFLWRLIRIALPQVSWFVAATAQMSGNAVSKIVPGGGPVGAALQFRMLSVSGVEAGRAATALAATGMVSAWVLFALPLFSLLVSLVSTPVPRGMVHVAWGGAVVFILMFVAGVGVTRSDRMIEVVGAGIERVNHWVMARLHREGGITVENLKEQRDEMIRTLGSNFRNALLAAIGNWTLDYLVLVAALLAVGARPNPSLVLLAYAVAMVLAMIPITPGGLGFVEAGLTAMLTLAGVAANEALLATLAYRLFSYWLPLPAGLTAYLIFRRQYGKPPEEPAPAPTTTA